MENLLTRANVNDFLINFIGVAEEEVSLMPDYVKKDIVDDNHDLFLDYFSQEIY